MSGQNTMDRDLRSIQEVRNLLKAAKEAESKLACMDQAQIDKLTRAVAEAGERNADHFARLSLEETGFGRRDHKVIKNSFAARSVYEAIRDLKTVGVLREDKERKIVDIGVPVGILAGLIPSTNPTSTVIYKTLIALKAGCPIVFSPHPSARHCICEAARILSEAAMEAGCPPGAIGCIREPTLEATDVLMKHRDTRAILATGGSAMVRAAYSSGSPAIGVGPGNGPSFIHRSADIPKAVRRILDSKTFDHGVICASEQSVILTRDMEAPILTELTKQGCHLLSQSDRDKLSRFILRPNGTMNPAIVGKSVETLVQLAGLEGVPEGTRLLLAREDGVGREHPFSSEKLGLILAYYVEEDDDDVLRRCVQILDWEGRGHTFSIHGEDQAVIRRFSERIPASRILVNTPSALGGIGATTGLFPALTLGCGAAGGSSSSNNIGPMDLINIRRVAWGLRELSELPGANSGTEIRLDDALVARLVEQIVQKISH